MAPHGAKNWWYQAAEGTRMYNAPEVLHSFMVPPSNVGIRGLRGVLNASERSDFQLLMTPAWTSHAQALVLLAELMNIDRQLGAQFSAEVGAFGQMLGDINARLPGLDSAQKQAELDKVDAISGQLESLNARLSLALRKAQSNQQTKAVVWTLSSVLVAGGLGFWIFLKAKKKR